MRRIIINPTALKKHSRKKNEILQVLAQECTPFLDQGNRTLVVKGKKRDITLTNPLQLHASRKHPATYRIEVLENDELGAGGYGAVYKSLGRLIPERKYFFKSKPEAPTARICKKISIQTTEEGEHNCSAPDIIREYRFTRLNPYLHCKAPSFDEDYGYLTMRYVGSTNLYNYCEKLKRNPSKISIQKRMELTYNILKAIKEQVFDLGILHKDLKPDNIRIDPKDCSVYIIDYAFANWIHEETKVEDICGTLMYLPPEILHLRSRDRALRSEVTEMFSVGLILAELWGNCSLDYIMKYRDVDYIRDFHIHSDWINLFYGIGLDPSIQESMHYFLNNLVSIKPSFRMNIEQALHEWELIQHEYNTSLKTKTAPLAAPQTTSNETRPGFFSSVKKTGEDPTERTEIISEKMEQLSASHQ